MITLSLPPTTNNTYRHSGHFVYMTKKAKVWIREQGMIAKSQIFEEDHKNVTVMSITYFLQRERDVDGSHKIIVDLLTDLGVMNDDRELLELHLYKKWDKQNPRVEITWR